MKHFVAAVAAFGLVLGLATPPVMGQSSDRSPDSWFRANWQAWPESLPSKIRGSVYNDSPFRVMNVRLRVEGFGDDKHEVGERSTWAIGDIAPDGETGYAVEAIPGAVDYRVSVVSFDVVSATQAP